MTLAIGEEVPPVRPPTHPSPLTPSYQIHLKVQANPPLDPLTAAPSRAAQNAMSSATLGAHEIVKHVYPDPLTGKEFLERASGDWYTAGYRVYLWL